MNDRVIKASEYFSNGRYCSQAVLGAFCESYDLDNEVALKISCGLNSGVRCAGICGAVTGAVLVIGLKHGNSTELCNLKTEEFIQMFTESNGGVVCRDILGCDISTADGKAKAINDNLFQTLCADMVISASQILVELGY